MKKFFIKSTVLLIIFGAFVISGVAMAAKNYGLSTAATQANYTEGNAYNIVQVVINTMLIVIAFVFFGYTTYAGLRWLTARGNEEFVARAKGTMETSIIGLVIVMAAYAITNFVFKNF
jgi:hypothetical protein